MIKITSCERQREPEFSRSECLELARRIESGEIVVITARDLDTSTCAGTWELGFSPSGIAPIIAALRAYAE